MLKTAILLALVGLAVGRKVFTVERSFNRLDRDDSGEPSTRFSLPRRSSGRSDSGEGSFSIVSLSRPDSREQSDEPSTRYTRPRPSPRYTRPSRGRQESESDSDSAEKQRNSIVRSYRNRGRSSSGSGSDSKEPSYGSGSDEASYRFAYAVRDDYTSNDFGHGEEREGKQTVGSYYVLLPDGRRQTVNYVVDGYKGYVADVQYSGEIKSDSNSNSNEGRSYAQRQRKSSSSESKETRPYFRPPFYVSDSRE